MSDTKTYEDGVRDGKIEALENTAATHSKRLDTHSSRLGKMEKILYIANGVMIAFNMLLIFPQVTHFFTN